MRRIALAAFACLALAAPASAQTAPTPPVGPDFAKIAVVTTDLGHKTWMLEGAGGNVTVAAGDDGIIMVDGQFAPMHDKLKAAIAAVTPQKVTYLINTHHHGDHTGGNAGFAAEGATVVGHVNERAMLAAGTTSNTTGIKFPPVDGAGLPTKTYTDALTLQVKGRTAALTHPANAHTGGDTFVWFKDANVLSTGDTFTNGRYPNIDFLNGGSIKGVISAADIYLSLADGQTKIVPGHGPLATKAQLAAYRAMMVAARERMVKLVKEGKSLDEVYAAKPFADFDAAMKASEQQAKAFMRVVYMTVDK
ncbi:MAG TPA: MBL fold metallo-hydrolase [Pseudolabrys sp.]|nr:MBL fold metallo-hydrolase [Pseudolabrys sp.]